MLSFYDGRRLPRRSFLKVGSLGLGGLTLPGLLAAQANAAGKNLLTGKSVIFLHLHGGPPQAETFDPKMTSPSPYCSANGEVQTCIPGVTFGSTFRQLARHADKLALVRSFTTQEGTHGSEPLVGKASQGTNVGSLFSRVAGATHPANGMPRNVAVFPSLIDDSLDKGNSGLLQTKIVDRGYAPFSPGSKGSLQQNMRLSLPRDRVDDRRSLLHTLDRLRHEVDASGQLAAIDKLERQAYEVVTGAVADAWDFSQEDPKTIERYDTSKFADYATKDIKNYKSRYVDHALSLGKLLLLARRLCEAGCGFVTVSTTFAWDMHGDENNANVVDGMRYSGEPMDHAVSAFLEDVEARGLSDKILLVACGEMGRTPHFQRNGGGGRDHWGRLAALLLAGGGLKMGQVIGQSDRQVGSPASEPIMPQHLIATIMQTLFDVGQLRLETGIPSDLSRLITGPAPIPGLIS